MAAFEWIDRDGTMRRCLKGTGGVYYITAYIPLRVHVYVHLLIGYEKDGEKTTTNSMVFKDIYDRLHVHQLTVCLQCMLVLQLK
jgi:hypothetical protein